MSNDLGHGSITQTPLGYTAGQEVSLYTLTNARGCVLKISNYGATVSELHVPDRDGNLDDIVLGFESLAEYVAGKSYLGAIAGRVANRIENGAFELDGKSYQLARNDGQNHLHGGLQGFNKVVWTAKPSLTADGPALELKYLSRDGEEGYPGNLSVTVSYRLTNDSEFRVDMQAESAETTLVNLAHHSYFNLAGYASGSTLGQELQLNANEYTAVDPSPGVTKPVAGSAFDFRTFKPIGRDLSLAGPVGYDHNFIVLGSPGELREAARVRDPKSGRVMIVESDQPGLQFYCGSFLDGSEHGKGARYEQYAGFCLESQKISVCHQCSRVAESGHFASGRGLSPPHGSPLLGRRSSRLSNLPASSRAHEAQVGTSHFLHLVRRVPVLDHGPRATCYRFGVTRALFQPFPMLPARRAQAWRHDPAFQRPRHFHEEPELNLVLRGNATFGVGDKVIATTRGDVLFFQPALDHVLLEASADLDLFVVALRPELAARVCGALTPVGAHGCKLSESETSEAQLALHALSPVTDAAVIETVLGDLFCSVKARCAQPHVLSRLTLQHVSLDFESSASRLARVLGTDPSALSRHFHDDLHVRFVEYRARLRLMSFVRRADLGASLSRAALDAGFGSYAQCHRVFTRVLGCAPRHYFQGKRSEIDAQLQRR